MERVLEHRDDAVIELTQGVLVRTLIPRENHSALRSGFVGYPANPRWSVTKFRAWRQGRQWREALARQEMKVRASDGMLVPADTPDVQPNRPAQSKPLQFIAETKRLLAHQLASGLAGGQH